MKSDERDLNTWLEPELEARVVASVLRETSAFEEAELERLMEERPELQVFRRRLEAVHGLVDEAVKQGPQADWKLSDGRRHELLEVLGGDDGDVGDHGDRTSSSRHSWRRLVGRISSVAAVMLVLVTTFHLSWERLRSPDEVRTSSAPTDGEEKEWGFKSESKAPSEATRHLFFGEELVADVAEDNSPARLSDMSSSAPPVAPRFLRENPSQQASETGGEGVSRRRAETGGLGIEVGEHSDSDYHFSTTLASPEEPGLPLEEQAAATSPSSAGAFGRGREAADKDGLSEAPVSVVATLDSALVPNSEPAVDFQTTLQAGQASRGTMADEFGINPTNETDSKTRSFRGHKGSAGESRAKAVAGSGEAAGGAAGGSGDTALKKLAVVDSENAHGGREQGVDDRASIELSIPEGDPAGSTDGGRAAGADPGLLAYEGIPSTARPQLMEEESLEELAQLGDSVKGEARKMPLTRSDPAAEASTLDTLADPLARGGAGGAAGSRASFQDLGQALELATAAVPDDVDRDSAQENGVIAKSELQVSNATPEGAELPESLGRTAIALAEAGEPGSQDESADDLSLPLNFARVEEVVADELLAAAPALPDPGPEVAEEKSAAEDPFSTFSLHVGDVAFKLARAAILERNERPDPAAIRPEEFLNAFDYGDPAPRLEEKIAFTTDQALHPFRQQRRLVRLGLRTAETGRASGVPLAITLLLDTSGSMEREDRQLAVARAMKVLVSELDPQDQVTLIGFARQPRLIADRLRGDALARLPELVQQTPSEGGTHLEAALRLGGEAARRQFIEGGQNRIVLITDGAANLGDAEPESLRETIGHWRQEGIAFDACGVGAEGLNDAVLEALTRSGDGRYYFLDGPEDADAGFARQLAGAFRPAARDVKVQVRFHADRVGAYRLVGFENHRLDAQDFRNDAVDGAELAAAEAAVALYEVEVLPEGRGEIGEVWVRFRDGESGRMMERSWTIPYQETAPRLPEAAPAVQLASAAMFLSESLRGGRFAQGIALGDLGPVLASLRAHYGKDARVADLLQMIEKARDW